MKSIKETLKNFFSIGRRINARVWELKKSHGKIAKELFRMNPIDLFPLLILS